jgi:hypothetical protein
MEPPIPANTLTKSRAGYFLRICYGNMWEYNTVCIKKKKDNLILGPGRIMMNSEYMAALMGKMMMNQ